MPKSHDNELEERLHSLENKLEDICIRFRGMDSRESEYLLNQTKPILEAKLEEVRALRQKLGFVITGYENIEAFFAGVPAVEKEAEIGSKIDEAEMWRVFEEPGPDELENKGWRK